MSTHGTRLTTAHLPHVLRHLALQQPWLVAAGIGGVGALLTVGFREAILWIEHLVFGRSDSLVDIATGLVWWQRLLAPALGGVLAGWLLQRAQRHVQPTRESDYMEAIALGNGDLGVRYSLWRALSSLATVTSGGAIGREGPMVQLAALAGSVWGRWWGLPIPRRRLYVACGAAAGIATAYNAPIAGALFIAEIVLHSLAMQSLAPLMMAAVAAHLVVRGLDSGSPVYQMPVIVLTHDVSILILAMLGLLVGLVAPVYLQGLERCQRGFRRWSAPLWLKLGTGGLMVGAISVVNPGVWGNGDSVVNSILQGHWAWEALVVLLLLKCLAVAVTTGSGAVGGIFTPTLFVGAALGALLGLCLHTLWPDLVPLPAMVAAGMGAFLAACTHAPLMSILMIVEMTQNYTLLVPLMAACVTALVVAQALGSPSIYAVSPQARASAPILSISADLLHTDPAVMTEGSRLSDLEAVFAQRRWQHTYVLDRNGRFLGAISLHDCRLVLARCTDPAQTWPDTLLNRHYPRLSLEAPMWQVRELFKQHPGERLPVLDRDERLVGYVTKSDLLPRTPL